MSAALKLPHDELMRLYRPDTVFLIFDYETYSEANIKKTSSYEYALHPSTEVLCASWRLGTRKQLKTAKVKSWAPKRPWNEHRPDLRKNTQELVEALLDPTVIIVAHNALFEQAVTRFVLPKHLSKSLGTKVPFILPHHRFFCTLANARVYGLPPKLEAVTAALNLEHRKDMEGHRLMLKWSKPRKPTKNNPSTRQDSPKEFDRLVVYCEHDIYAETSVFLTLEPHIPSERRLWLFDQEINFRGALVDRELVQKILKMIQLEKKNLTKELQTISDGEIKTGGQTDVIRSWLSERGVALPDLKAKTISDAITLGLVEGDEKRVLELRQYLSKTSLKKYPVFLDHTVSDSRMRFSLNYNVAVHGRWGGAGVQPHNFPRGSLKHKEIDGTEIDLAPLAAELINSGADLELIRLQFENPMEVFVSCLRAMIVPTPGKELHVADFAAIEARVLFWLAEHIEGVKAFAENRPMYEEMAMDIFNVHDVKSVTKDQRFVGKQTLLGSGYGMGWKKFLTSCRDLGREVSVEVAKLAINSYREKHSPVVKLWNNLESAAIKAVENPGKTFEINKTKWFMKGRFLCCVLPSGRPLFYYGPSVRYERTPWGAKKPNLYHWSVNSRTRKWENAKTWGGVLTQNCVGGTSRDLLAESMMRHQRAGYDVLLTIHDETITERNIGEGSTEEFSRLMKELPAWAKGCPVNVEAWSGFRYRK